MISIRDAGAENALIGSAEISLVPLLHDATEARRLASVVAKPNMKTDKSKWGGDRSVRTIQNHSETM